MSNTTGTTCGAGSAYPSGALEISPSFWWGSCCLVLSFLCCVLCTIICVGLFIFSHGVVSLFLIYEFECHSGNFRQALFHIVCIQGFLSNVFFYYQCWMLNHALIVKKKPTKHQMIKHWMQTIYETTKSYIIGLGFGQRSITMEVLNIILPC